MNTERCEKILVTEGLSLVGNRRPLYWPVHVDRIGYVAEACRIVKLVPSL